MVNDEDGTGSITRLGKPVVRDITVSKNDAGVTTITYTETSSHCVEIHYASSELAHLELMRIAERM